MIWKSKLAWLFLLWGLSVPGCRSPLPDRVIKDEHFILHAGGDPVQYEEYGEIIGKIMAHYETLFRVKGEEVDALRIVIESRDRTFESAAYPALYRSENRTIYFKERPDCMLLLHEIAHHFIQVRLGDTPLWLNEGLATYLGWSAMGENRLIVGEIPIIHYKTLKEMERKGTLLPLEDLFALTASEFYQVGMNRQHYSQAWGFIFFLLHGAISDRLSFSSKLERIVRMEPRELLALDEPFRRFCRDYSATQTLKERLASGPALRRLSSAFRLGLLQDDAALDVLIRTALNRTEDVSLRMVALYAGAMIILGSENWKGRWMFTNAVYELKYRSPPAIRQAAILLSDALQGGDGEAVTSCFAELGSGCSFYPAAHFVVKEGKVQ